ncbi:MAG TPA: hypothetical protein VJT09_10955, partial [Pyrinomonadaceae bacterium]|nr:hypothetical protein [Pyrinomonadaceae bacterium]
CLTSENFKDSRKDNEMKPKRSILTGAILALGLTTFLSIAPCSTRTQAAVKANAGGANQLAQDGQRKSPEQQEGSPDSETVETRLDELFELCRRGDASGAATYFVYRGPDKSREWKDTYRAGVPAERAAVGEMCLRIKGYLDKSLDYTSGEVRVKRESEGEWHVVEVTFRQEEESQKITFAFLRVKGRFAIGDID